MKSLLTVFIFTAAVCQVFDIIAVVQAESGPILNVTIFYETLCFDKLKIFKDIRTIVEDPTLRELIHFEMVPFGKAHFINPQHTYISCHHGIFECYGNAMNACFMDINRENYKHVEFISCCMNSVFPPFAGKRCADKLGYNFRGVRRCAIGKRGTELQKINGERTLNFTPKLTYIPTVAFDNDIIAQDQKDAFVDLQAVITKKLEGKGVKVVRKSRGA